MQEGIWEVDGAGDVGVSKMKTLPPSATVASALFGACVSRTRQEVWALIRKALSCVLCPLTPSRAPISASAEWRSLCPALAFLACCVAVILGGV